MCGGRLVSSQRLPVERCVRLREPLVLGGERRPPATASARPGAPRQCLPCGAGAFGSSGGGWHPRSIRYLANARRSRSGWNGSVPSLRSCALAPGRRAARAFPADRPTRLSHSARPRRLAPRATRPGPGPPTSLIEAGADSGSGARTHRSTAAQTTATSPADTGPPSGAASHGCPARDSSHRPQLDRAYAGVVPDYFRGQSNRCRGCAHTCELAAQDLGIGEVGGYIVGGLGAQAGGRVSVVRLEINAAPALIGYSTNFAP